MTKEDPGVFDRIVSRRKFLRLAAASVVVISMAALPFGRPEVAGQRATRPVFTVLVVGDSIMWGQGLREGQKFYSLVAENFRNEILRRQFRIDANVVKNVKAHSGATIGAGDNTTMSSINGEVPTNYPTIIQQIGQTARFYREVPHPDNVSLVLVNGGINDIGVNTILNPLKPGADIVQACRRVFLNDMGQLLSQTASKYRYAKIIVTGYYPLVTADTDLSTLMALVNGLGLVALGPIGIILTNTFSRTIKNRLVENSRLFADHANSNLAAAVSQANSRFSTISSGIFRGRTRVSLAIPAFGPQNATFASDPLVYGLRITSAGLTPEDPIASARAVACTQNSFAIYTSKRRFYDRHHSPGYSNHIKFAFFTKPSDISV